MAQVGGIQKQLQIQLGHLLITFAEHKIIFQISIEIFLSSSLILLIFYLSLFKAVFPEFSFDLEENYYNFGHLPIQFISFQPKKFNPIYSHVIFCVTVHIILLILT